MTREGMTPVKLSASVKFPRAHLTIDMLRAALDELEATAGVPRDAEIHLKQQGIGGAWEITSQWVPDPMEADPFPPPPPGVYLPGPK